MAAPTSRRRDGGRPRRPGDRPRRRRLAELGGPDRQQVFAYDLAHAAAGVATAKAMLAYGERGDVEARLTCGFVADAVHDLVSKLIGREQLWGVDPVLLAPAHDFVTAHRDPEFVASLAARAGPAPPRRRDGDGAGLVPRRSPPT